MKKWLLREQPQEKLDLRLWQTFRNIDLQTAIKLHEENPAAKQPGAITSPKVLTVIEPKMNRKASVMFVSFSFYVVDLFTLLSFDSSLTDNDELIVIPMPTTDDLTPATSTHDMKSLLHSTMYETHRRVCQQLKTKRKKKILFIRSQPTIHARTQDEVDSIVDPSELNTIHFIPSTPRQRHNRRGLP